MGSQESIVMPSVKPYQIWQTPTYLKLLQAESECDALPDFASTRARLAKTDHAERLAGFVDALRLLNSATLDKGDGSLLYAAATKTLRNYSKRSDTRLAGLRQDLFRSHADHLESHDPWNAWWMRGLADPADNADHPELNLELSDRPEPLYELDDLRARGLLLELANRCLDHLEAGPTAPLAQDVLFEKELTDAQMSGKFQPLITLVRNDPSPGRSEREAELALWLLAVREREWVPLARKLARGATSSGSLLAIPMATIADLYESGEATIGDRVEVVGQCLGTIAALPVRLALLGFGALARALFRTKQVDHATRVYAVYQTVSQAASQGQLHDGLLVTADIGEALDLSLKETRRGPPTALGPRTVAYGQFTQMMLSSLGYRAGLDWIRRITRGPGKGTAFSEQEMQATLANAISFLGAMKGPILKLGQVIATYRPNLSPELAERLQQVPELTNGIDPQTVVTEVERELGKPLSAVFAEFSLEPAGVGSMGQVHYARTLDGRRVAVKVLFPDIEKSIAYDLRVLKTLTPVVRFLAPSLSFSKIVNRLAADFLAETDLRLEARNQDIMRTASTGILDLYIPSVHHEFSTRRLLVTDWVDGKKFEEFRATASLQERERAGRTIVRFVVRSCLSGTFNSDPNPGNFLFTPSGVAAVDFGSVRVFSPEERRSWANLIRSCHTRDRALFKKTIFEMGMAVEPKKFDFDLAYDTLVDSGLMSSTQEDKFVHIEIEQIHRDLADMLSRNNVNSRYRDVPPAFIQGYRVYFGHAAIVSQLGPEINLHAILKDCFREVEG